MSRVNTSEAVRMHRQTGPDYRVRKADVERSMKDKTVLQKIYCEKSKSHTLAISLNALQMD